MKVRIEVNEEMQEEEIVIRCKAMDDNIKKIKLDIETMRTKEVGMVFYRDEKEFFLKLNNILFFETENNNITAHTIDTVFTVKYKLYELEEILPKYFIRISKSTILNVNEVIAITKNISSSSLIEFKGTHKNVYVSRHYYKGLKIKLEEVRSRK